MAISNRWCSFFLPYSALWGYNLILKPYTLLISVSSCNMTPLMGGCKILCTNNDNIPELHPISNVSVSSPWQPNKNVSIMTPPRSQDDHQQLINKNYSGKFYELASPKIKLLCGHAMHFSRTFPAICNSSSLTWPDNNLMVSLNRSQASRVG